MAFQFVHIETYAEQPKAVKGAPTSSTAPNRFWVKPRGRGTFHSMSRTRKKQYS